MSTAGIDDAGEGLHNDRISAREIHTERNAGGFPLFTVMQTAEISLKIDLNDRSMYKTNGFGRQKSSGSYILRAGLWPLVGEPYTIQGLAQYPISLPLRTNACGSHRCKHHVRKGRIERYVQALYAMARWD